MNVTGYRKSKREFELRLNQNGLRLFGILTDLISQTEIKRG